MDDVTVISSGLSTVVCINSDSTWDVFLHNGVRPPTGSEGCEGVQMGKYNLLGWWVLNRYFQ